MKAVLLPVAVALLTAAAAGAGSPPPEYIDKGACPFECCVYRTWDTKTDTVVYAQPERNARIVGLLKAGAAVEAITGEVHAKPARFLVKRRHGEHKPGEVLWVYTYLGEGHFRVWWNGAMHDVDLGFSPYGGSPGARCEDSQQCWGELERALRFTWWVKVRSKEGWEGWSDQPEHFGNKDACGERPSGTKIERSRSVSRAATAGASRPTARAAASSSSRPWDVFSLSSAQSAIIPPSFTAWCP